MEGFSILCPRIHKKTASCVSSTPKAAGKIA
jgi:hypothetical protein